MTSEEFEVQVGKQKFQLVNRKRRIYVRDDSGEHRLCRAVTVLGRARHQESRDVFFKVKFRLGGSEELLAWIKAGALRKPNFLVGILTDKGAEIASFNRAAEIFCAYLERETKRCKTNITIVSETGWYERSCFVMPGQTYGQDSSHVEFFGHATTEDFVMVAEKPLVAGDLAQWWQQIGEACLHSRLVLVSVGVALAAPCLVPLNAESFIMNSVGGSGIGKTGSAQIAQSAFRFASRGALSTWDKTATGAEDEARQYRHQLVLLDELSRAGSGATALSKLSDFAFRVTGSATRRRADAHGSQRASNALYLSNSEVSIAHLARLAGSQRLPGEAVRIFDVPIEPGAAGGVFDTLPDGFATSTQYVEHLAHACGVTYGAPAAHFLTQLTSNVDAATGKLKRWYEKFKNELAPKSTGTGTRLVQHFAVIYAALRLAQEFGTLNVSKKQSTEAVLTMCSAALNVLKGDERSEEALLDDFAGKVWTRRRNLFDDAKKSSKSPYDPSSYIGIKSNTRKHGRVYFLHLDEFTKVSGKIGASADFVKVLASHGALLDSGKRSSPYYQKAFVKLGVRESFLAVKKSWLKGRVEAVRSPSEKSA